jgi:tRNA(Ile)-lysidine synthase
VTDLLQRIENSIQNRKLLKRGQKILVAVSGGLDSMVLLHALEKLSARHKWKIAIAHFNHQLRGRASDEDEKLVIQTAKRLGLQFVVERGNVRSFARSETVSIEMAARIWRHAFLAPAARRLKISHIALAHHADDQVELFFLRVMRGAGGAGLAGMKWSAPSPADKKVTLIRPMLDFQKEELRKFARENKIRFRDDATNFLLDARRNRIRNELLPLLREKYQSGLAKTVLRLMEIVGAESDLAGELAEKWLKERQPDFEKLPIAVQRHVLQLQLRRVKLGIVTDFDLVEQLRKSAGQFVSISSGFSFRESIGKFVSVNSGLSVSRDMSGTLKFRARQTADFDPNELGLNLAGKAGRVNFNGVQVLWRFDAKNEFIHPKRKVTCEFFDAEKIGGKIILRHWRPGDRFQPIGLKSDVKLQDLFTNAKIPHERRRDLIIAEVAGGEIFWVEGLRISENFKITPETRRQLIWHWKIKVK